MIFRRERGGQARNRAAEGGQEQGVELTNEQLLEQAQQGDTAAGDALVQRLREPLVRWAMRFAKNQEAAEDLVQNAFVKLLEHQGEMPNVRAWLHTVIRNRGFNLTRDSGRHATLLHVRHEDAPVPQPFAGPEEVAVTKENTGEMAAAMEQLSPDHAEVLRLRYFEDLSYQEIAKQLGVKIGTVMSRLNRAKASLAEVLGRTQPDEEEKRRVA